MKLSYAVFAMAMDIGCGFALREVFAACGWRASIAVLTAGLAASYLGSTIRVLAKALS